MGVLRFRLVRNILALYGVRAVDQLLPIVVIPFLARVLGADGWGLVASAQALAIYGIITVEYGFELAGTRAVARDRANGARLAELISGIFATQLMLACAVALAAILVRLTVPEFQDQPLLLWAALAFAILQGLYPLWFFVGQERIPLIAHDRGRRQGARDDRHLRASCAVRATAGSCSPPTPARPCWRRPRATR